MPIELVIVDEAGGATKQVTSTATWSSARTSTAVIGYISSGDCLAVAPVAEEMKKLTVLLRLRHAAHLRGRELQVRVPHRRARDDGQRRRGALPDRDASPNVKTFAGINQNYAWGQDSWKDFRRRWRCSSRTSKITTSQMPKFGAGQYGAEISALLGERRRRHALEPVGRRPEALHPAGRAARAVQEAARWCSRPANPTCIRLGAQMPDGTIIGARGPYGVFAPDTALNTVVPQGATRSATAWRRTTPPTGWRRRCSG